MSIVSSAIFYHPFQHAALFRSVIDIKNHNPSISSESFPNFFYFLVDILISLLEFCHSLSFQFLYSTNSVICGISSTFSFFLSFFHGPEGSIMKHISADISLSSSFLITHDFSTTRECWSSQCLINLHSWMPRNCWWPVDLIYNS
jgi:hypothetical protein